MEDELKKRLDISTIESETTKLIREMTRQQIQAERQKQARPIIDLNTLEGVQLKVGNETIFISKEELLEVVFKLFPNLVEKYTTAVFSEE